MKSETLSIEEKNWATMVCFLIVSKVAAVVKSSAGRMNRAQFLAVMKEVRAICDGALSAMGQASSDLGDTGTVAK